MEFLSVLAAAGAAWVFGAVWYSIFAKPWVSGSRVPVDDDGAPINRADPKPYLLSILAMLFVAGTMRYAFSIMEITTAMKGLTSGMGIGMFFIAPWIMLNNGYAARPFSLTLIDGGYAAFGCAIIGLVIAIL
ncbi:MAG: DUF1761 domain-containing protein [Pseudomonadota bacterium]